MEQFDVVVVGGGPAGSAAAWAAANQGCSVAIIDKAVFPRDKPCGDGLLTNGVDALRTLGLADQLKSFHRIDGAEFRYREGSVRHDRPSWGVTAPREHLDALLLAQARAAGAKVTEGTKVTEPVLDGSTVCGVRCTTSTGAQLTVPARVVIAADGAHSILAKTLRTTAWRTQPMLNLVRAVVDAGPAGSEHTMYLELLEQDGITLPAGGWAFPLGDSRLNIGVGVFSTYRNWKSVNLQRLFDSYLTSLRNAGVVTQTSDSARNLRAQGSLRGWIVGLGRGIRPAWAPGLMLAGDAAAVASPLSGAGIFKALKAGMIAGRVAAEALDGAGPQDLSQYERDLARSWGRADDLGVLLLRLVSRPALARASVRAAMRFPKLALAAGLHLDTVRSGGDAKAVA